MLPTWVCIVISIIALLIGVGIGKATRIVKIYGNLHIDRSEPDEPPKIFFEMTTSIRDVSEADYVTLKVINKNYLSQ